MTSSNELVGSTTNVTGPGVLDSGTTDVADGATDIGGD